jgi:hypothetical protein
MNVTEYAPQSEVRWCLITDRQISGWKWGRSNPWGGGEIFIDVSTIDPSPAQWVTHAAGYADGSAQNRIDGFVAETLRRPADFKLFFASDAQQWAKGDVAGTVVDARSHQIVQAVRQIENATNGPRLAMSSAPIQSGSNRTYAMVAAHSGRRQEIAFFTDRNSSNVLRQQMRIFDWATQSTVIKAYLAGTLSDPVAATYRAEDDAYYLLDKTPGPRIALKRIARGLKIELLQEWPRGTIFTKYGLTTGDDGSLVITTGATPDFTHCIAVLRPESTANTIPANLALLPYKVFMGPLRFDQPAELGVDSAVSWVSLDAPGNRVLQVQAIADGTTITTMAQVGQCF